jgi:hypothetical protein
MLFDCTISNRVWVYMYTMCIDIRTPDALSRDVSTFHKAAESAYIPWNLFVRFFFSVGRVKNKRNIWLFFSSNSSRSEKRFFFLFFFIFFKFLKKQTSPETRARVVERSGYSADVVHQLTPFLFRPALFWWICQHSKYSLISRPHNSSTHTNCQVDCSNLID